MRSPSTSGADAPAVTPILRRPASQDAIELIGAVHQIRRNAEPLRDLAQPVRVRAVFATDDDHDIDLRRHELDRVLSVLRRVTDVGFLWLSNRRESPLQRRDNRSRIVQRQRRLRYVGKQLR